MTRPAFEREGYMTADYESLTAEQLEGATVYDANDERVGEIKELVLSQDGKIEQAVVDVGGFLGMGEHSVAMSFEELQVMTNEDRAKSGSISTRRARTCSSGRNISSRPGPKIWGGAKRAALQGRRFSPVSLADR